MGDGEEREAIKGGNVSHSERTMGRQRVGDISMSAGEGEE